MGTEDKKDTRPKRSKEEIAKYYEEKKKQKNYRGIECNTSESYATLDVARYADMVIKNIRSGVFIRYPVEVVKPLIEAYNDACLLQLSIVEQMAEVAGMQKYRIPKNLATMIETHRISDDIQKMIEKIKEIGKKEDVMEKDIKPETVKK
jgi:hypothetical protein